MKLVDALKRKAKAAMAVTSAKARGFGWAVTGGFVVLGNTVEAAITCPASATTGIPAGASACEIAQSADFGQITLSVAVVIAALITVAVVIRGLVNVWSFIKPGKMR